MDFPPVSKWQQKVSTNVNAISRYSNDKKTYDADSDGSIGHL